MSNATSGYRDAGDRIERLNMHRQWKRMTAVMVHEVATSSYRIVPHSDNLPPSRPLSLPDFLLKIFQNLNVSSPAPVTTV